MELVLDFARVKAVVESYTEKVDSLIDSYADKKEELISLLQDIEAEFNYLPQDVLVRVSQKLHSEAKRTPSGNRLPWYCLSCKGWAQTGRQDRKGLWNKTW